jgi:lipopolysaccharide export system permease protein
MILLAAGIGMGFVIFFLSAYLQALGASRELPPMMAAWAPALICTLGGLGVLMMTEDG